MTETTLITNMLLRGTRAGISAGVLAGIILSIPMAMLVIDQGLIAGFVIGGVVGFINGACLAAVHLALFYPAGTITNKPQYRRGLAAWMAVQTAVLTFIGARLMYPDLELEFYAVWGAPILGFLFAIPVTYRITRWYLSTIMKKKRAYA